MEQQEIYDLLIIADATYSMSDYLTSLQTSLPQIISISALTGCFSRIGLLGYRDYCDQNLLEWSGWLHQSSDAEREREQPDLVAKAKSMEPLGGGDYPEATKTALAKAYEVMRPEATTIILLYTDAPPHAAINADVHVPSSNYNLEKKALSDPKSYGSFGPSFADWVSGSKKLRSGEKKAHMFCVLEPSMAWQYVGYYNYLSTMTGGSCVYLENSKPVTISKVTVEVLLAWMGVEKTGTSDVKSILPAVLSRYKDIENIKKIKHEDDPTASPFFATTSFGAEKSKELISANIATTRITPEVLMKYLPKKRTPVSDFANSWKTDAGYRHIAIEHLKKIITSDVRAMALNPVFGSLWRTVCNDRTNDDRNDLIAAFGLQIERISNADEKASMKAWLEESYDYSAEVQEIIAGVPAKDRFPCVCLDPTLCFELPGDGQVQDDEDNERNRPITDFRRDELLEISRSCDPRILRRLGRILARLTYVESAADMPKHIASTSNDQVPKIPMALASQDYGRQFWRVLLHIIVPGTMLSARPAALLAALSLRLGIEPLTKAAEQEMRIWRERWCDVNVTENWNVSCLGLLLDADQAYRQKQLYLRTPDDNRAESSQQKPTADGILRDVDRTLFENLVEFKMLELNLDAPLTAQIGWTPAKTVVPIGPVSVCRECKYPRSVTIMGRSGKCGHCLYTTYSSPDIGQRRIHSHVSKEDNDTTPATWVECFVRTCRAQYVVYNLDALNVRPKCHYCRSQAALSAHERNPDPAPWVECVQCLNRMIWPEAYRPSSFSRSDFVCPPCTAKHKTITEVETTAKKISAENSTSWLVSDSREIKDKEKGKDSAAGKDIFPGRSLYHTISTIPGGPSAFLSHIHIFPFTGSKTPLTLYINNKLIRNPQSLITTLQALISLRTPARAPCSLCFSTYHPTQLNPACGRHSCAQRICRPCLSSWYGINTPGRAINVSALHCPFCRRAPAGPTLAKHGLGIHAVANLAAAVRDQGTWVYAWCAACGFAKRALERVCARGMAELSAWTCDECKQEIENARLAAERDRAEREMNDTRMANDLQRFHDAEMRFDALKAAPVVNMQKIKRCPGCGVWTQKISGCDHIVCAVRGCGVHWCWFCAGGPFGEREVYRHLRDVHGGWYTGGDGEEEED